MRQNSCELRRTRSQEVRICSALIKESFSIATKRKECQKKCFLIRLIGQARRANCEKTQSQLSPLLLLTSGWMFLNDRKATLKIKRIATLTWHFWSPKLSALIRAFFSHFLKYLPSSNKLEMGEKIPRRHDQRKMNLPLGNHIEYFTNFNYSKMKYDSRVTCLALG